MSSETFDFGAGPVPAHRHVNGGGWVADRATVSEKAWVGPHARVVGGTIRGGTIWGGTIRGGTIEGGTIWGGTIRGGTIEGGTIVGGTIWGGTIWGGTIVGGTIEGGTIRGGTLRGGARITRTADCLVIGPLGSRDDMLTVYPDKDGSPLVCTGCFEGTPGAFVKAVRETHGTSQTADEYTTAVTFLLGLWAARREVES